MRATAIITGLWERSVPEPLRARVRAAGVRAHKFLQAYWQTLVTFDAGQIEPSRDQRRRSVATAQSLAPFLKALAYRGSELDRVEAVPHFHAGMDIADLRVALVNLGYKTDFARSKPAQVDQRLMPCLHEDAGTGAVCVLLGVTHGTIFAFIDGHYRALTNEEAERDGTAYFAHPLDAKREARERQNWSNKLLWRFKPFFAQLLVISALSNVLSITVPLFVMTVYDQVIGLRALDTLPMLIVGVAAAIAFDLYLKTLRAHLLGTIAARVDYLIGTTTFAKLLRLPLSFTSGPPVSAQIARLREFQAVRDLFAGPAATAIVDFPFTIIALAVVAAIAGWLVLVPLLACVAFAVTGFVSARWLQAHEQAQSASSMQLFNHVTDTALHHESLKREGAERVWLHRFRLLSGEAATRSSDLQDRAAGVEALGQFLNTLAATAVLATGAMMVLYGAITVGALIATMALTWRILSPAQQLFQTLGRLGRLRTSIQSMNQMLRLADEHDGNALTLARAPRNGAIALSRVSLRYAKDGDPVLMNVNLTIPPRKMVALTGSNGSGKSSILRVIQNLYQPQAGVVSIDGVDIRQLTPKVLRRAIACAPRRADLFYGTIAQNLRMADALADDEALHAAAAEAGVLDAIMELPQQFETRIGDATTQSLPPGFLKQLSIARALVKKAPILLLDEPEALLDGAGADAVQRLLERLRGTRTVVFASQRPSYIRAADFAVFMRGGLIEYGGKPDGAIERLLGAPKNGIAA